jgi:hypothetical protein
MMSVEEGRYFSLNEAGARIWELLATPVTQPAIVEKLMGEYDVSPEVCSAQVKDFINALSARHLISEAGQNTTQCG